MELEDLSLLELKEKAKEKGLKNLSKLRKEEIISLLKEEKIDNNIISKGKLL